MIAFLAPLPVRFGLPNPGDQFRYTLAYSGRSGPTRGAETDTFSDGETLGQKCLKEVVEHTTRWSNHGRQRSSLNVATFWESVSPARISFLAISLDNHTPVGLSSPGYKPPVLKPGASWSDKGGSPDILVYQMSSKVLRKETVAVPGGTFPCWVIQKNQVQIDPGQRTTFHMTCWWSPALKYNVKTIYEEVLSNGLPLGTFRFNVTQSLTAYTLAKRRKLQ